MKMQLKVKYQLNTESQLLIFFALPKAHQSVSVIVNFKSYQNKQNPPLFMGKVASKYPEIMTFCL